MSSTTVPLSGGRTVSVDFQKDPLPKLLVVVQLAQAAQINGQVKVDQTAVSKRNDVLRDANAALTAARSAKGSAGDKTSGEPAAYSTFIAAHGIPRNNAGSDTIHNKDEWEENIQHLQTFIETLNSTTQLDMARLSELTSKHSQQFDLLTTFLQKSAKTMESIAQMR